MKILNLLKRDGVVADVRRSTKLKYHYAIRKIKRQEENLRNVRMAGALVKKKDKDLWGEVRKMRGKVKQSPPHVDNIIQPDKIAQKY